MTEIVIDRRAQLEADRAMAHFRTRGMLPVNRFVSELYELVEHIRMNPDSGIVCNKVFRWRKMNRYKYIIYYKVMSESSIRIYAIAHASRKPGYWLRCTRTP